jgi:osmotically-inducible protein OsmY
MAVALGALLSVGGVAAKDATLNDKVRHEINNLPYMGVFDAISYELNGNSVVLTGAVHYASLSADAAGAVKRIPGVESVDNQIELLPVSGFDDQIRLAAWRAAYSWPALARLAAVPLPPVRILVRNGHITLVGVVPTQADKDALTVRLNGLPYVFEVINNLTVENSAPHKS